MTPTQILSLILDAVGDDALTDAAFRALVASFLHDNQPTADDIAWARQELDRRKLHLVHHKLVCGACAPAEIAKESPRTEYHDHYFYGPKKPG